MRTQQRSLAAGRVPQSKARWHVVERSAPRSETADVLLIRAGEPVPIGYAASEWLPRGVVSWRLGRSLAAARRRMLRAWFDGLNEDATNSRKPCLMGHVRLYGGS